VEALPAKCQALILAGNPSIEFETGVLEKAVSNNVALDLQNVLFVNTEEANHVLDIGVVKPNYNERTVVNQQSGFACFNLLNTSIQISPEKFAPERLCACPPGWIGSGALCQKCPRDSFKEGFSSKQCTPCPPGSTALVGSTSVDDCKCKAGKLYNSFGTWTTGTIFAAKDTKVLCVWTARQTILPTENVVNNATIQRCFQLHSKWQG